MNEFVVHLIKKGNHTERVPNPILIDDWFIPVAERLKIWVNKEGRHRFTCTKKLAQHLRTEWNCCDFTPGKNYRLSHLIFRLISRRQHCLLEH